MSLIRFILDRIKRIFGGKNVQHVEEPALEQRIKTAEEHELELRQLQLDESKKKLDKLRIVSNFFKDVTLSKIHDRCVVIHQMFANNSAIAIKKLEQFHYYYTEPLLDFLQKLKQNKEQNILILDEECKIIQKNIDLIKIADYNSARFKQEKHKLGNNMGHFLCGVYRYLTANIPFAVTMDELMRLSQNFKADHKSLFYEIPSNVYSKITEFKIENNTYKYKELIIEKKLLGKLNNNLYGVIAINGLITDEGLVLYMFKINDTEEHFIYIPDRNILKMCKFADIHEHLKENDSATREKMELINQKERLMVQMQDCKQIKEQDNAKAIHEYLEKVSSVNFLESLAVVDVEREHLRNMLKMTQLEI